MSLDLRLYEDAARFTGLTYSWWKGNNDLESHQQSPSTATENRLCRNQNHHRFVPDAEHIKCMKLQQKSDTFKSIYGSWNPSPFQWKNGWRRPTKQSSTGLLCSATIVQRNSKIPSLENCLKTGKTNCRRRSSFNKLAVYSTQNPSSIGSLIP